MCHHELYASAPFALPHAAALLAAVTRWPLRVYYFLSFCCRQGMRVVYTSGLCVMSALSVFVLRRKIRDSCISR